MLSQDELADLADDIRTNGLVHAIVVDDDGMLIDGRNRLAACKIAGVEPRFERLIGTDPAAYIVSSNLKRRNLKKGQQAMATAMIYPDPDKRGRGNKSKALESKDFSVGLLSQCRAVLDHSRALGGEAQRLFGQPLLPQKGFQCRGLKASATEGFSTSRLSYARTVRGDQALARLCRRGRSVRPGACEAWRPHLPCHWHPYEPRHRRR
jgi:hypothetical protein